MQPLFSGQLYVAGHIDGADSVGGVIDAASMIAAPITFALRLTSVDYLDLWEWNAILCLGRSQCLLHVAISSHVAAATQPLVVEQAVIQDASVAVYTT